MTTDVIKRHYQDNSVARSYDKERFAGIVGRAFDAIEKRALRKVVGDVLRDTPQPKVLDVPCGTGRITEFLLRMGLEVTGSDISREMMDIAKVRCERFSGRITFEQMDLDAPDLPENAYDLVTCIRMLHHLDTNARKGVFRSLARLTRKYVLVNVSYSSPFYRWRRRVKRAFGQGVSRESSTWLQILEETSQAGLCVKSWRFILPFASEDLVLLLTKAQRV